LSDNPPMVFPLVRRLYPPRKTCYRACILDALDPT